MHIDWSKAPEGAEFYSPSVKLFYRHLDGEFQKFSESRESWTVAAGERYEYTNLIAKPTEWNGECLPPVGSRAYVYDPEGLLMYGAGEEGEVVAHVENTAVIRMSYGLGCFTSKHLRTPEQIAAEERGNSIAGMKGVFDSCSDELMPTSSEYLETLFGALYDAGYRKFEIVEG